MKTLVFAEDWRDYLVDLAVQAGADPAQARERMSQASQVMAIDFDLPTRHAEPAFIQPPESKL